MKKTFFILFLLLCCLPVFAADADIPYLAEAISAAVGDAPFVVRVAFGEMLVNRLDSDRFPDALPAVLYGLYGDRIPRKKASESDIRAAAAAYRRLGFAGGALYVTKWSEAQNTPLVMRSGVRLYDWFFYI